MPDPRQLLNGSAQPQVSGLVAGIVSGSMPLPATSDDPLYVIVPNHSTDIAMPMRWAQIWGSALPEAGADVIVALDDNGVPRATWWDGEYTAPPALPVGIVTAIILASAATIQWSFGNTLVDVTRIAPAGNVTGIILSPCVIDGRTLRVINESAFTVTFAASGTSNVADGVSDVIAALTARAFTWDAATSLWYRSA